MTSTEGRPGKAISLLLLGVAGGLGLDLCAKQLLQTYPLDQFIFLRSVIGVCLFLVLVGRFGGMGALRTQRPLWHLARTLLSIAVMYGFFYGLTMMPLIDALTLGYTAPLIVTAMSAVLLREHVGWRRWSAVLFGFAGVLVMLRPGIEELGFESIAVLFAAFGYACLAISSRHISDTESSLSLTLYVIVGPMLVAGARSIGGEWISPDATGYVLFFLAAACSVLAWVGIVGAYRQASPAMLAPFEYSALVAGAVAGYVIWNEVPDRWSVAGATMIVAAGLFVALREVGRPISGRYLRAITAAAAAVLAKRGGRSS